jgi:predicted nucleotidyltransferase
MSTPQNAWKTRLVVGGFPDRSFDIEFWQEQGDEAIFAAAWELVLLAEEVRNGREPTPQEPLRLLNEFDVEYLIVGGLAVMKYGEPRYTKDLDVWVDNSPENSARVVAALRKFGAPIEHDHITVETFTNKQIVYQIGVAPLRIDILTQLTGVAFPQAWKSKVSSTFFGVPVNFISLDDLIANKQALGRTSDANDLRQGWNSGHSKK